MKAGIYGHLADHGSLGDPRPRQHEAAGARRPCRVAAWRLNSLGSGHLPGPDPVRRAGGSLPHRRRGRSGGLPVCARFPRRFTEWVAPSRPIAIRAAPISPVSRYGRSPGRAGDLLIVELTAASQQRGEHLGAPASGAAHLAVPGGAGQRTGPPRTHRRVARTAISYQRSCGERGPPIDDRTEPPPHRLVYRPRRLTRGLGTQFRRRRQCDEECEEPVVTATFSDRFRALQADQSHLPMARRFASVAANLHKVHCDK